MILKWLQYTSYTGMTWRTSFYDDDTSSGSITRHFQIRLPDSYSMGLTTIKKSISSPHLKMTTVNCYATRVNTIAESDVGEACTKLSFVIEFCAVSCRLDGKLVWELEWIITLVAIYEGDSVNKSQVDIKRKACDIRTWKKKVYFWHILH
jgi:hypothetical protein